MTVGRIDPRFSDPTSTAPEWAKIEQELAAAQLYWIVTGRKNGRPHAVPLVGVWHDGAFAFCTGASEQKSRNLDSNANVAVLTGRLGTDRWDVSLDISVEGRATRVTDAGALQELADAWFAKYGDDWKWQVRGDVFVGSGPDEQSGAQVYLVAPEKIIVFGNEHGQTTFRFEARP